MSRFIICIGLIFLTHIQSIGQDYKGIKEKTCIECLNEKCTGESRLVWTITNFDKIGRPEKAIIYVREEDEWATEATWKYADDGTLTEYHWEFPPTSIFYIHKYSYNKEKKLTSCIKTTCSTTDSTKCDTLITKYFYNTKKQLIKEIEYIQGTEQVTEYLYNAKNLCSEKRIDSEITRYQYNEKDSLIKMEVFRIKGQYAEKFENAKDKLPLYADKTIWEPYEKEEYEYNAGGKRITAKKGIWEEYYYYNSDGLLQMEKTKTADKWGENYYKYEYKKW